MGCSQVALNALAHHVESFAKFRPEVQLDSADFFIM